MTPEQILEFFKWVGSPACIMATLSLLAERSQHFQALSPERKTQVSFVVCFGLPALSALGMLYLPPAWLPAMGNILGVLGVGAAAYIANQGTHWLDKSINAGVELVRRLRGASDG